MIRGRKQRKLAWEILGLIGVSAFFAAMLFLILIGTGGAVVQAYCDRNQLIMTEFDWLEADRWIWSVSGVLAAAGFSLLFLALLSERMTYIRTITRGIHALRLGQTEVVLPLEGNNELTELTASINLLSETQQQLRRKEQQLAREKAQFLRALSHDIRTPLTSVLAYSEYLLSHDDIPKAEQKEQLELIRKRAEQIRDLTALLLDGDKRSPEHFPDAKLLMAQLAAEFQEELEGRFAVSVDLSGCPAFAGTFDVQELRRIFDNLTSNVQKYADPHEPVVLRIRVDGDGLTVYQTNAVSTAPREQDSYKLGINSIRRIAQNYAGGVEVRQDGKVFAITVRLSEIL